jgi:predicted nucleic acid-binding protein
MSLILDTSILIDIGRARRETLRKLEELSALHPGTPQITFTTHFEFLLGLKDQSPRNKAEALAFLNTFEILQTTRKTAEILVELKHASDRAGHGTTLADLLIASQAIENHGVLVTKDRDFDRISGLKHAIIT